MEKYIELYVKDKKLSNDKNNVDYCWQHYDLTDSTNIDRITNDQSIDENIKTALTDQETRPRIETHDDGVLLVLRGVNYHPGEDDEDMVSIRIWATEHKIITTQYRSLKTTLEFLSKAQGGKPEQSVSVMLAKFISVLFHRTETTITSLSDTVDEIEESISESFQSEIREDISTLRKKIVVFKRHILPHREVVSQLRYSSLSWFNEDHQNLHNDNYERIMRNIEDLEMMRDKLNIIKEEVQYLMSEKLNRNTYVLSMITAIFLPLGFLTGLFGINIGGMPGTDNNDAFWLFCIVLFVLVLIQVIVFRKKEWF